MMKPDTGRDADSRGIGRRFGSQRLRAALALGAVLSLGTMGTFAYWTDSVTVQGNTFSSGTLDLKVNGVDANADFTTLNLSNMAPGNTTAGVLTVRNAGNVPLKYTASVSATNLADLGGALQIKVTNATATTGTKPSQTCGGTTITADKTLNGILIGTGRLLTAGAEEKVCVQVTLPTGAANTLQGKTTTATITVNATSNLS